jgi:hypothetical protein
VRLVGAVMRLVEDGAVILRNNVRYFAPLRELGGLRLERGNLVSFTPATGARRNPVGLAVRLHDRRLADQEQRRWVVGYRRVADEGSPNQRTARRRTNTGSPMYRP